MTIFQVIQAGHVQTLRALLDNINIVVEQNDEGDTPIVYAAKLGQWDCVRIIAETFSLQQIKDHYPLKNNDYFGQVAYGGYYIAYKLATLHGQAVSILIDKDDKVEQSYQTHQVYTWVRTKAANEIKQWIASIQHPNLFPKIFSMVFYYFSGTQHWQFKTLLDATIYYADLSLLKLFFQEVHPNGVYANYALDLLILNAYHVPYLQNPLLQKSMLDFLEQCGASIIIHKQQICETGNLLFAQQYAQKKCHTSNPLADVCEIAEGMIECGNHRLLRNLLEDCPISVDKLLALTTFAAAKHNQPAVAACFKTMAEKTISFDSPVSTLLKTIQILAPFCQQPYDVLPTIPPNQPLKICTEIELYQLKLWMKGMYDENIAHDNTGLKSYFHQIIKKYIFAIDSKFKDSITFEKLDQLIELYGNSSIWTRIFTDPFIKMLAKFRSYHAEYKGKIANRSLQELYEIIKERKRALAKNPEDDYFHDPRDIVNQIFFRLIWFLGRVDEFDLNSMLPEHHRGVDEWWEHVGSEAGHAHLYELPFDDLYVDKMSSKDEVPAVISLTEAKNQLAIKSKILRASAEAVVEQGKRQETYFNPKQMQTLFRDRPDMANHVKNLHVEQVLGMDVIRSSTLDQLDKIFEEIYLNSFHHPKNHRQFEFNENLATQQVLHLVEFLRSLPNRERRALMSSSYNGDTLESKIAKIKDYQCTGLLGEWGKALVTSIRHSRRTVKTKEVSEKPSSYQEYLKLIDDDKKSKLLRLP
jgi:hypothetical protein